MSENPNAVMHADDISPRTIAFVSRDFLRIANTKLMLSLFGAHMTIPKNRTTHMTLRRYNPLPTDPKVVIEGVTPAPTKLSAEDLMVTLVQYGEMIGITDVIADTHEDPIVEQATTRLGEQAGEMLERVLGSILLAGTNVHYANGTSRSDVNTKISRDLLRRAVKGLERQRAQPITKMLSTSDRFNTVNIKPSYVAICHPDLAPDIEDCTGFKAVEDYGQISPFDNEIGSVGSIRFIKEVLLTPYAGAGGTAGSGIAATGGKADVYAIPIIAKDAYACVALKGHKSKLAGERGEPVVPVEVSIVPVHQKDKSDPMGQRGFIGYLTWFAALITQQAWLKRLEVACTD